MTTHAHPTPAEPDLRSAYALVLRAALLGGADADVARAAAARADGEDADAWVLEWTVAGGAAWAARRHLDAAAYYGAALAGVARSSEPERFEDLWRRQRGCWDRAVAGFSPAGQRLAIPYEDTTLPAYFFPAPGAVPGERRAAVIVNNDAYGPTSQAWVRGGAAAAARGHHWLTFDGPGQQAALVEQGLHAREDWEAVLGPVVDAVAGRRDVDPERIAALGLGEGGWLVARALAFEHRLAAAALDPAVVDLSAPWRAVLPARLRDLLHSGDHAAFDAEVRIAGLFDPDLAAALRWYRAPYDGGDGASAAALFTRLERFRLDDDALSRITTPLLVAEDDDAAGWWPGQARALHERLRSGDGHALLRCADPAARTQEIADWLSARLR